MQIINDLNPTASLSSKAEALRILTDSFSVSPSSTLSR